MGIKNKVRRAWVEIIYKNKNITQELTPYLQTVTATDNLEGKLDDLNITLLNIGNKFLLSGWTFKKGDLLDVKLKTLNWENENEGIKEIELGKYYIDEKEFNKDSAQIKAVSSPLNALNVVNSKTWNSITLKRLGEEFAKKYKLEYLFLSDDQVQMTNLIQEKETDFSFLNKTAQEAGLKLKITERKLVLFEESSFYKNKPTGLFDLIHSIDYNLRDKTSDIYDSVEVSYFDTISFGEKKQVLTYEELLGKTGGTREKTLKIKKKPAHGNLKKYALKLLEQANKSQVILELTIPGYRNIFAGNVIEIVNSGEYDGKYLVNKVVKSLPGFICKIESYKIEDGEK